MTVPKSKVVLPDKFLEIHTSVCTSISFKWMNGDSYPTPGDGKELANILERAQSDR